MLQLEYSSLVIFAFINGLIKISVLLFYRRIFVVDRAWSNGRNLFFTGMITLIGLWAGVSMLVFIFMCGTSFQTLFQSIPADLALKCVDTLKVGWQYAISDFVSDGLIVLIPIPFVGSFPSKSPLCERKLMSSQDLVTQPPHLTQICSHRMLSPRYTRIRCFPHPPRMDVL